VTLFWRSFLLIAALIVVSVLASFQIQRVYEREPRARELAQQTVSIVNLTRAALVNADPVLRRNLLIELNEREGIRLALLTSGEALEPLPGVYLCNRGIFLPDFSGSPALQGFNFVGGFALTPEFAALLLGLTTYTAAFIAEIVRAGILSVRRGQFEAAFALGLARRAALRYVILPQALRLMVPPMTSQYLNLTKNSSLAVAIGYPDLVSIANTSINQTGQAIEGIAIIMAVYLSVSLAISALMNWYNRRIALRGAPP